MVLSKEQRDFIRKELERGMINKIVSIANTSRVAVHNYFTMKTVNNENIENAILTVYGELKKRREERKKHFERLINE